jgi:hypothetical protein
VTGTGAASATEWRQHRRTADLEWFGHQQWRRVAGLLWQQYRQWHHYPGIGHDHRRGLGNDAQSDRRIEQRAGADLCGSRSHQQNDHRLSVRSASITKMGSGTFNLGVTQRCVRRRDWSSTRERLRSASGVTIGGTGTITLQGPSGLACWIDLTARGGGRPHEWRPGAHVERWRVTFISDGGRRQHSQTLGALTTNRSKTNVINFNPVLAPASD